MHKITRQEIADGVAKRWARQYPASRWPDKQDVAVALKKLPMGAPPSVIDEIIGNTSWTNLECDECGDDMLDFVIQVGEPDNYESRTANLCGKCIGKLKRMF